MGARLYIEGMIRYVLPAFFLLSCSTQIPDYEPMQAQVSSEEDMSSAGTTIHEANPGYWAPTIRGEWSSGRMWKTSSSVPYSFPGLSQTMTTSSSSHAASSGSTAKASSSSWNGGEVETGALAWTGDCEEQFGVSAGEHEISWSMSNCTGESVTLYCSTLSGESCGASITFDFMTYFAGVGEDFQLGAHEKDMAGGSFDAVCDLVCWLE